MLKFITYVFLIWGIASTLRTDEFSVLWKNLRPLGMIRETFHQMSEDALSLYEFGTSFWGHKKEISDNLRNPSPQEAHSQEELVLLEGLSLLDIAEKRLDRAEKFLNAGTFPPEELSELEGDLKRAIRSNDLLLAMLSPGQPVNNSGFRINRQTLLDVSELNDRSLERWRKSIKQCRHGIRLRRNLIENALHSEFFKRTKKNAPIVRVRTGWNCAI